MEVKGIIHVIGNEQQVSASFKNRELVLRTEETYPQYISIKFVQDKCDLLNGYKVGQEVNVSINLRGRLWTNPQGEEKCFNEIQGWRITSNLGTTTEVNNIEVHEPEVLGANNEDPDLPF